MWSTVQQASRKVDATALPFRFPRSFLLRTSQPFQYERPTSSPLSYHTAKHYCAMPPFLVLTYDDSLTVDKPVVRIEQGEGRLLPSVGPFSQQNPIDIWLQQSPKVQIILSFNDSRGFDIDVSRYTSLPSSTSVQPLAQTQSKYNIQNLRDLPEVVCGQSANSPPPLLLESKHRLSPVNPAGEAKVKRRIQNQGIGSRRKSTGGGAKIVCPHCPRRFRTRGAQTLHLKSHREQKEEPDSNWGSGFYFTA